jgi:ribosomal protein L19E
LGPESEVSLSNTARSEREKEKNEVGRRRKEGKKGGRDGGRKEKKYVWEK